MKGIFHWIQLLLASIKRRWQTPFTNTSSSGRTVSVSRKTSKHQNIKTSRLSLFIFAKRFLGVLTDQERKLWWGSLGMALLTSAFLMTVTIGGHIETIPRAGGEYTEVVVGSPHSINPLFAPSNDAERDLNRLLYAGLVKPSTIQSTGVELDLAESVDVGNDGRTYTVTLKPNLKWHDGEPLTTNDIAFTLRSIQNPDWKSPLAASFRGVTITITDERTMSLQLTQPVSTFATALSVGILPEHLWKNVLPANARLAELNIKPKGSGPFRFLSMKKDKEGVLHSYTVERNPYYPGQYPLLNRMTVQFVDDADEAYTTLQNGDADGANRVGQQYAQKPLSKEYQVFPLRLPQYTALFFNPSTNDSLNDPVVRDALHRSVDKQTIITTILGGDAEVINGPLMSGMWGYDATIPAPEFNTQHAEELLNTAGWKRIDQEEWKIFSAPKPSKTKTKNPPPPSVEEPVDPSLPALPYHRVKGPKALRITITTVDQKELREIVQRVVNGWRAIGIDARVNVVESEKFQTSVLNARDYEVLLYGQQLGTNQDPFPFWHSSQIKSPGLNLAQLSDKKVDQLLEDARKTSTIEERGTLYREFQQRLLTELPAIFLFRPISTFVVRSSFHPSVPEVVTRATERWNTITQWYQKTKWSWK